MKRTVSTSFLIFVILVGMSATCLAAQDFTITPDATAGGQKVKSLLNLVWDSWPYLCAGGFLWGLGQKFLTTKGEGGGKMAWSAVGFFAQIILETVAGAAK